MTPTTTPGAPSGHGLAMHVADADAWTAEWEAQAAHARQLLAEMRDDLYLTHVGADRRARIIDAGNILLSSLTALARIASTCR